MGTSIIENSHNTEVRMKNIIIHYVVASIDPYTIKTEACQISVLN